MNLKIKKFKSFKNAWNSIINASEPFIVCFQNEEFFIYLCDYNYNIRILVNLNDETSPQIAVDLIKGIAVTNMKLENFSLPLRIIYPVKDKDIILCQRLCKNKTCLSINKIFS